MSKLKNTNKDRGSSTFYRFANWVILLLSVVNIIVIVFFELDREPKEIHHNHVVTTNHLIVVTNYISTMSESVSSLSRFNFATNRSDVPQVSAVEVPIEYDYFIVDGRRAIRFCGRHFSEGSPTSYGTIKTIFPDRVLLENGVFLKNTTPFRDRDVVQVSSSPVRSPQALPVEVPQGESFRTSEIRSDVFDKFSTFN